MGRRGARHDEDIDLETGQLSCQLRELFKLSSGISLLDEEGFAFQVPRLPQPLLKRGEARPFPIKRGGGEKTDPRDCLRLLRLSDERRGEEAARHHPKERPSFHRWV